MKLRLIASVIVCVALTSCAGTLTVEQRQERRERWSRVATTALQTGFLVAGHLFIPPQPLPTDPAFRK